MTPTLDIQTTKAPNIQGIRAWVQLHQPDMSEEVDESLAEESFRFVMCVCFEAGRVSWDTDRLNAQSPVDHHQIVKAWCALNRSDLTARMGRIMQEDDFLELCRIGINAGRDFQRQNPHLELGAEGYGRLCGASDD